MEQKKRLNKRFWLTTIAVLSIVCALWIGVGIGRYVQHSRTKHIVETTIHNEDQDKGDMATFN